MAFSRHSALGFRLLLGLALALASWAALTPDPLPLPQGLQMDKWAHLATYVVLAFLVDLSWPDHEFNSPKWAALLAYGIMIELVQSQIPSRMFSPADVLANATGVALYAFLLIRALRAQGLR